MYFLTRSIQARGLLFLENRASLDDALEIDAIFFIVGVRFYVTDPAASFLWITIG